MLRSLIDNTRGRDSQPRGTTLASSDHALFGDAGSLRGSPRTIKHLAALASAVALASALGGCGMSSLTSGLGGGMFGGSSQQTEVSQVSEDQLLAAAKNGDPSFTGSTSLGEVAAGCPRMVVTPRDNHITFYEAGRIGDGLAVTQRGEITKTARECQVEPGRVTVRYGISGRVLLGPKGKPGNYTLPVNVVVNDSKREKIASDSLKVDVSVGLDKPIGYFSAVRVVTFPIPEGTRAGEFEVQVGFDTKVAGAG